MAKKSRRPREYLFIDGYNIINSWDNLKELSAISLGLAREELIEMMVEYRHYLKIRVVIVFDAHMVKTNSGKEEIIKGVKVVYTKEHQTADNYIEKELNDIGRVERVRVATSDWMEQQIVLGRGGTRISARELEVEMKNYKKLLKEKRRIDNDKNDLLIGRLDAKTLDELNQWGKKR